MSPVDVAGLASPSPGTRGSQLLDFALDGETKVFTLTTQVARWSILPGVEVGAYTYNGAVPGPMIRVTAGDQVRIVVNNELPEPTSVHWHGLQIPNDQAGAALLDFFKPRVEPGTFGGKVVAGQVAEFQPGTVSHVREGRFFISRLEDGGMLALWHRCTHLGCTVPLREDEGQFHCPCHSSIFTTRGEVVSGPAPRPLDIFPSRLSTAPSWLTPVIRYNGTGLTRPRLRTLRRVVCAQKKITRATLVLLWP